MENFSDDDYMIQVDVTPGFSGGFKIWLRYKDANNVYRLDDVAKNPGWNSHVYSVDDGKAKPLSTLG